MSLIPRMVVAFVVFLWPALSAGATSGVSVFRGPTPIPGGSALGRNDITLDNGVLAVSFSVDSHPPWGVPPGGIVDGAVRVCGQLLEDQIALVDFMPSGWSAWPDAQPRVRIEDHGPDHATVISVRDHPEGKVTLRTTVRVGDPVVQLDAVLVRHGNVSAGQAGSTGFSLCPEMGRIWVPGTPTGNDTALHSGWIVNIGSSQAASLYSPGSHEAPGDSTWRILSHETQAAGSRNLVLRGFLRLDPQPDPMGIWQTALADQKVPTGLILGRILDADGDSRTSRVVFRRDDVVAGWATVQDHRFMGEVPAGTWELVPMSLDGTPGDAGTVVSVGAGVVLPMVIESVCSEGAVRVKVVRKETGRPLPARIEWEGHGWGWGTPEAVHFTHEDHTDGLAMRMPTGSHRVRVSHGDGFLSRAVGLCVEVKPGEEAHHTVTIPVMELPEEGWRFVDLHHHSNILDGRTNPEDLVASQKAEGLDVALVSDHDSVASHLDVGRAAQARSMVWIPSMEVSPSWAHSNLIPLLPGLSPSSLVGPDVTPSLIRREADRLGALVQLNHPFDRSNGWFTSVQQGVVPELPESPWFDLLELNGKRGFDSESDPTLRQARQYWSEGRRIYLSGGSDTHDVRGGQKGRRSGWPRTAVHTGADHSVESVVKALKSGQSYVTFGPLLSTSPRFGEAVRPDRRGHFTWKLGVASVNGIRLVRVRCNDQIVFTAELDRPVHQWEQDVSVISPQKGWCQVEAEDFLGRWALSNPCWVERSY